MPSWNLPKEPPRENTPGAQQPPTEEPDQGDAPANPFLASKQPGLALDALLGGTSGGSGGRGSGSNEGGTSSQLEALISGRPSPFVDEHRLVSRSDLEQLLLKEISSSKVDSVRAVGLGGLTHTCAQQSGKLTNSEILRMGGSELFDRMEGASMPSLSLSKLLRGHELMPAPYVDVIRICVYALCQASPWTSCQ